MYWVYILWSEDYKVSYTGTTNNLAKRVLEHNSGNVRSTKVRRPWLLIHREEYESLSAARKREWFLKCTPQGGKEKRKIIKNFLNGRDGGRKAA